MEKNKLVTRINNSYSDEISIASWSNDSEKKTAMLEYSKAAQEFDVCNAGFSAGSLYNYSNLDPYSSSRQTMTREKYGYFRPEESIPTKIEDIIKYADKTYHEVGIIRNIIDLMGDFACQGIRLSHVDPRIEKFYRNWFSKVNGKDRSERFLNLLFRLANVIIRRQYATINLKQRSRLFKTSAQDLEYTTIEPEKNRIPINYTFLHPCTIEVIGDDLAAFTNKKLYAIKLPARLRTAIQSPMTEGAKKLVAQLPADIKLAARFGKPYPLPPDSTLVFHYKKDDWENWAYPMIHSVAKDVILLDKLKLADIAALDGAISNIRIFKLGSLEHNIVPGRGLAAKLNEILKKNTGVGTIDIVWGPDIEIEESQTNVHNFLGEDKYKPTLNSIFGSMGIPQSLTGFSTTGTTNNFISLKTLIQRLKYARGILVDFWATEIAIVQEAMSFEVPAEIEFDYPDLGDSASEKALLVQLADRNLVSNELLMDKFGHNSVVEEARIKREFDAMENETRPPKYGPYLNAQTEDDLEKIALQQGMLTPEQLGIDPEFGKSKPPIQKQIAVTQPKKPGETPQKGRPTNSKDKTKRKTKTFKPKTKASIEIWAKAAQEEISNLLYNPILDTFGKKSIRSLTNEEHIAAEDIKFNVLLRLSPMETINKETIASAFAEYYSNPNELNETTSYYSQAVSDITFDLQRQLTVAELRDIQAKIYTDIQESDDED